MRQKLGLCLLVLSCFSSPSLADNRQDAKDYWLCTSQDENHKSWTAKSSYRLSAINKSYEACKKNSKNPASCQSAREQCDAYINGTTTRPMWQCSALDFNANVFSSNVYRHRDDALLAARAYCQDKSHHPDSCYSHLISCENKNPNSLTQVNLRH